MTLREMVLVTVFMSCDQYKHDSRLLIASLDYSYVTVSIRLFLGFSRSRVVVMRYLSCFLIYAGLILYVSMCYSVDMCVVIVFSALFFPLFPCWLSHNYFHVTFWQFCASLTSLSCCHRICSSCSTLRSVAGPMLCRERASLPSTPFPFLPQFMLATSTFISICTPSPLSSTASYRTLVWQHTASVTCIPFGSSTFLPPPWH